MRCFLFIQSQTWHFLLHLCWRSGTQSLETTALLERTSSQSCNTVVYLQSFRVSAGQKKWDKDHPQQREQGGPGAHQVQYRHWPSVFCPALKPRGWNFLLQPALLTMMLDVTYDFSFPVWRRHCVKQMQLRIPVFERASLWAEVNLHQLWQDKCALSVKFGVQ